VSNRLASDALLSEPLLDSVVCDSATVGFGLVASLIAFMFEDHYTAGQIGIDWLRTSRQWIHDP